MSTSNPPFADPHIVETWITGWSLAREVATPVREHDCFRVDVGWPKQKVRYVFPKLNTSFQRLAESISEPWHFLKVCAAPEPVRHLLPSQWQIQPLGFMMICEKSIDTQKTQLPQGYTLESLTHLPVPIVKVLSADGKVAAIGRVTVVNDFVIYDRIETHPDHRRQGLGSLVMKKLQSIGTARGATKGVLVATAAGKALYETLGWQLHALYTTAVIPGLEMSQNIN